jgi:para-nitrobenzyl esterase
MRASILLAALVLSAPIVSAVAQLPTAPASAQHYSTSTTDIGTLIDDPAAHAIVDGHLPGVLSGDQIDMARSMTLEAVQQFAPDQITDKALADIDAELAKLPPKGQ